MATVLQSSTGAQQPLLARKPRYGKQSDREEAGSLDAGGRRDRYAKSDSYEEKLRIIEPYLKHYGSDRYGLVGNDQNNLLSQALYEQFGSSSIPKQMRKDIKNASLESILADAEFFSSELDQRTSVFEQGQHPLQVEARREYWQDKISIWNTLSEKDKAWETMRKDVSGVQRHDSNPAANTTTARRQRMDPGTLLEGFFNKGSRTPQDFIEGEAATKPPPIPERPDEGWKEIWHSAFTEQELLSGEPSLERLQAILTGDSKLDALFEQRSKDPYYTQSRIGSAHGDSTFGDYPRAMEWRTMQHRRGRKTKFLEITDRQTGTRNPGRRRVEEEESVLLRPGSAGLRTVLQ